MKKTYLSVIIPSYNEEANLERGVLSQVADYLGKQKYSWEVIVADDGSRDGSARLVEKFAEVNPGFRLLKNPHGGKARAIRAALEQAKGEISLFTDMDQSTPISEIERLLPFFEKGFDIVIGSRGGQRKDAPWYRTAIAWGFRNARRTILLSDIIDTQCGFKAIKTRVGKSLFAQMRIFDNQRGAKGWRVGAWDVELLFLAQKNGLSIKEVRVKWEDKDVSREKGRNFVRESREMLEEIIRVRLNETRGLYGKKD